MLSRFKKHMDTKAKRSKRVDADRRSASSSECTPPPSYSAPPLPAEDDFVPLQGGLWDGAPFQSTSFAPSDQLRVLIVGGGIGGLATAIACARQGYAVTVLERGSGLSPHGDYITLGSNAAKILFRWGIGKQMLGKSARGGWWLQFSDKGCPVAEEDVRHYAALFDAPVLQGHRGQYLGDLGVQARLMGVDIRPNSEVIKYVDSSRSPGVVVRGGQAITADVLLICDGIHSNGRKLLKERLGPPAQSPERRSEYSIYRGLALTAAFKGDKKFDCLLDGNQRFWFGDDSHVTMCSLDHGRQISFTYTHRDPLKEASLDPKKERDISEVLSRLKDWDPLLLSALECFRTVRNWRIIEADAAAQWTTDGGKISFLGDAVHYLLPTSNQGGSQAIEDGATVAICLALAGGQPADVPLALRTYETMRRPRVVKAQTLGVQTREAWYTFARTGNVSFLAFQCTEMYSHDAERHALSDFEREARTIDSEFTLSQSRRAEVLRTLDLV